MVEERKFRGLLVTTPPPEHPFRQQLEKSEGFVDVRLCVLPPAHVYHSTNYPCVVSILALESTLEVIVCESGGTTRSERLDQYQLLELPSYAPYFFTLRSSPNANTMFCIGHRYLANTHMHERVPPVDSVVREPLAFPYLRKGETFRVLVGEEAGYYGGATCVLVGTLRASNSATDTPHEVVSRIVWQENQGAWALVHHANGVVHEMQRDRAEFSKRASREMLLNAALFCMKEGNEIEFVSMFLVFAELLAPIVESDMLRDMSQRYAQIVGTVMVDKSDKNKLLRETVMRTQSAMARKQANPSTKTTNTNIEKGNSQDTTTKKDASSSDLKCAVTACAKKDNLRRCGNCKKVYYCGLDHQKEHWGVHKPNCKI